MDRRGEGWLRPRIWEMRKRQRGFRKRQDLGQSLRVEMGFNKWNWGGEEGLPSQERSSQVGGLDHTPTPRVEERKHQSRDPDKPCL